MLTSLGIQNPGSREDKSSIILVGNPAQSRFSKSLYPQNAKKNSFNKPGSIGMLTTTPNQIPSHL